MPPIGQEQQRNLGILKALGVLVVALVVIAGLLLYMGKELPPYEMRFGHTLPDGYAPPPHAEVLPAGSIARGSLPLGGAETAPLGASPAGKNAVPAAAEALPNPLAGDPTAAAAGRKLYSINCGMCHGGPGPALGAVGETYQPPPPHLSEKVPGESEGHVYYTITEGIYSAPTAEAARYLPKEWHAFREMTAKERWQVVAFVRQAFATR